MGSGSVEAERPDSRLVQQAVARAKAGDMEGLHFLYVRYAPDVQRCVASFVQDHHEAEDITQNVFAELVTGIGEYEQREIPFAAWILRVARNAALDDTVGLGAGHGGRAAVALASAQLSLSKSSRMR